MSQYQYASYQVRADEAPPVLAAARRVCCGLTYVAPSLAGWVAVYDEAADSPHHEATLRQVAADLSAALDAAVFALIVADGDTFGSFLYEGGRLVGEFDSWVNHRRPPAEPEGHPPGGLAPGNPAAVLRHCRPGTPPGAVADLLRRTPGISATPAAGDRNRDAVGRLMGLARLLGIAPDRACLHFRSLDEALDRSGRAALPGVRKVRGRGQVRPTSAGEPVGSLAAAGVTGDRPTLARFLADGGDPAATNGDGQSLLTLAAGRGQFDVAQDLLAAGARPATTDSIRLLLYAVRCGQPVVVAALVAAGVDGAAGRHFALFAALSATSTDRPTRATIAALEELLRAAGAGLKDVRSPIHFGGMAPVVFVAAAGHRQFIAPLVRAGADPDARDADGQTALIIAVRREGRGRPRRLVRALLAAGADPNCPDEAGATPLMHAVADPLQDRRAARLVADLLRAGAAPNARDGWGMTPLVIALERGHARAAALLRAAGAT